MVKKKPLAETTRPAIGTVSANGRPRWTWYIGFGAYRVADLRRRAGGGRLVRRHRTRAVHVRRYGRARSDDRGRGPVVLLDVPAI